MNDNIKFWILGLITLIATTVVLLLKPIAQNPAYHLFADQRTMFGIPNFLNIVSNLPFLFVGFYGMLLVNSSTAYGSIKIIYGILFLGIGLTALGSAYYHYNPTNLTLVYDRIPMTLIFMAFLSAIIFERINERLGLALLLPLLALGIGSILYWQYTESKHASDLRLYGLVQFYPMLLIVVIILLFPSRGGNKEWRCMGWIFAWYVLAKICEQFDGSIYLYSGFISGHSLKHLAAAIATWYMVRMFESKYISNKISV